MQANGRKSDRGVPFDAKGSPEVKVAFRPDAPFDDESPVDRAERSVTPAQATRA